MIIISPPHRFCCCFIFRDGLKSSLHSQAIFTLELRRLLVRPSSSWADFHPGKTSIAWTPHTDHDAPSHYHHHRHYLSRKSWPDQLNVTDWPLGWWRLCCFSQDHHDSRVAQCFKTTLQVSFEKIGWEAFDFDVQWSKLKNKQNALFFERTLYLGNWIWSQKVTEKSHSFFYKMRPLEG